MKTWFFVGSLVAFSLGCHAREESAVLRYPGSSLATRIDRSPAHLFLAEYDRVLVLERDGREVARRAMFPDSGGYSRTNAYDLGESKTLLLSAFDAYVLDYDRAEIHAVHRDGAASRGTYVGAFDTDDHGHWRFIAASEKPEVSVVNSVVVDYAWRPGVVTTDDWEFELLAPRGWIDGHVRSLGLSVADAPPPEDQIRADIAARKPVTLATAHWRDIYKRKLHPIRTWYATADARHRVFVSKH